MWWEGFISGFSAAWLAGFALFGWPFFRDDRAQGEPWIDTLVGAVVFVFVWPLVMFDCAQQAIERMNEEDARAESGAA